MVTKLAAAAVVTLLGLGGLAGWRVTPWESGELTNVSYKPKAELHVTVAITQMKDFLVVVEAFAAENRFELQHNLSGLPLKDGRGIIYLVFNRPDGVEFSAANPFHPDDVNVDFYDKKNIGSWKPLFNQFSNIIGSRFPATQTFMD
jgi:hypothetical protein